MERDNKKLRAHIGDLEERLEKRSRQLSQTAETENKQLQSEVGTRWGRGYSAQGGQSWSVQGPGCSLFGGTTTTFSLLYMSDDAARVAELRFLQCGDKPWSSFREWFLVVRSGWA